MTVNGVESKTCVDFIGSSYTSESVQSGCVSNAIQTYSSGHCSSVEASGACMYPASTYQSVAFYYGLSAELASAMGQGCTVGGGTWFTP